MKYFLSFFILSTTLLATTEMAQAECSSFGRTRFFPSQNDSVTMSYQSDGGACRFNYRSGGIEFTSATIISKPSSGNLSQRALFDFNYTPKAGFKGTDLMVIKVCATGRAGAGCSTITYSVDVK